MFCYKNLNKFKYFLCVLNAFILNVSLYIIPVIISVLVSNNFSLNNFMLFIILVAILNIIYMICNHIWTVPVNDFLQKHEKNVVLSYFGRVINVPLEKLNNIHTGYLKKQIDLVSSNSIGYLSRIMDNVLGCLVSGGIFLITTYIQDKKVFFIILVLLIVIIIYNLKLSKFVKKRQSVYNSDYSNYNSSLTDVLQNIKTIKKLDADKYAIGKIEESFIPVKRSYHNMKNASILRFNGIDAMLLVIYIVVLISLYFRYKNGENILSFLLFYITAFNGIKTEFRRLSNVFQVYTELKSANDQIEEMIGTYDKKDLISSFKTIEIKDVNFKYDKKSRKRIVVPNFVLNNGDKVSIIGKSGQGKTTFLNILSRFLIDDKATYLINGKKNDKNLSLAYISQDVDLLNISIKENICLGKKISDKHFYELLKDADLYDWIMELPDREDTIVGERGVKLSAGQKQRINILRGIVLDKELYILDEPTSNLDSETEKLIVKLIKKHLNDKTVVIVTHKMAVKKICNKHYVFNDGIMELKNN